jgi:hypothetical protein
MRHTEREEYDRVRAHLGGPVTQERVAARQAAYPTTAGAWTVVRVADQQPIGLVTIGADHRREGRAEISYQLLPSAWGEGLGKARELHQTGAKSQVTCSRRRPDGPQRYYELAF